MKRGSFLLVFSLLLLLSLVLPPGALAADATEAKIFGLDSFEEQKTFFPFGDNFSGGVSLAVGDVTGDSDDEIIAASGPGAKTQVRVFDKFGNPLAWNVFPFHPEYKGGASLAIGDTDGDGKGEIIVAPSGHGGPQVIIYDYGESKVKNNFFALHKNFRGGLNLAAGDINKDGKAEIFVATASERGNVAVYNDKGEFAGLSLFPFGTDFREGLSVAAGDVTGNGKADIIVGSLGQTTTRVKIYKADASQKILGDWLAFDENIKTGVNLAFKTNKDNSAGEILVTPASNSAPQVLGYNVDGQKIGGANFYAFDKDSRTGLKISAGNDLLTAVPAKNKISTEYCKTHKCVALTFDDGGSSGGSYEKILNTLSAHDVKATFFLIGRWMNGNRSMVERTHNEGHRLGNHTWNHSIATRIPGTQLSSELTQADELAKLVTGESLQPHFRYPAGSHNIYTDSVVRNSGYNYWQWTADTRDAMGNHSPASIHNLALSGLHPGSVILFHTGNRATADSLDSIIRDIKAQGYELVTLDYLEWSASNQW